MSIAQLTFQRHGDEPYSCQGLCGTLLKDIRILLWEGHWPVGDIDCLKEKTGDHQIWVFLAIKILHENEPQNEGVFSMFPLHPFQPSLQHFLIPRHPASTSCMLVHIILTTRRFGVHYYLDFKHKGTEVKRYSECSLLMVELRYECTSDPKGQILNHYTAWLCRWLQSTCFGWMNLFPFNQWSNAGFTVSNSWGSYNNLRSINLSQHFPFLLCFQIASPAEGISE